MSTKDSAFQRADERLTALAHGLPSDAEGFKQLMVRISHEPDPSALLGVLMTHGAVAKIQLANGATTSSEHTS